MAGVSKKLKAEFDLSIEYAFICVILVPRELLADIRVHMLKVNKEDFEQRF